MTIAITIILAFINGMCYRMGGSGNFPRWTRPVGIGFLTMATILLWGGVIWDWWYILSILATGGASAGVSTTYFKKKGSDAHWFNWLFVGLAFSLAFLPFAIMTHLWLGFVIRLLVLTPVITLWSHLIGWDIAEETGRGFLCIATIPLVFINV